MEAKCDKCEHKEHCKEKFGDDSNGYNDYRKICGTQQCIKSWTPIIDALTRIGEKHERL